MENVYVEVINECEEKKSVVSKGGIIRDYTATAVVKDKHHVMKLRHQGWSPLIQCNDYLHAVD